MRACRQTIASDKKACEGHDFLRPPLDIAGEAALAIPESQTGRRDIETGSRASRLTG